jgi:hypothetical protein
VVVIFFDSIPAWLKLGPIGRLNLVRAFGYNTLRLFSAQLFLTPGTEQCSNLYVFFCFLPTP